MKGKFNNMIFVLLVFFVLIVVTGCESKNNVNTLTEQNIIYKVKYDDFIFDIPNEMVYEITDQNLIIYDIDEKWTFELFVIDGNFNQVKSNKYMLQSYFEQNGFYAQPAEIKTIKETEFVTLEMGINNINFIGAYVKLNSVKTGWIVLYNQDNSFDYIILENIVPVITSATYVNLSNSIVASSEIEFDMEGLSWFGK